MSSAKAAVEAAVFAALNGVITDAKVFQDVPDNEPLPLVIIGDMKSEAAWGKDDPDRRISLTIVTMVDAEERAPLLALQEQIEDALDDQRFTQDGWTLSINFEDDDAQLGSEGALYVGESNFTVLALSNS